MVVFPTTMEYQHQTKRVKLSHENIMTKKTQPPLQVKITPLQKEKLEYLEMMFEVTEKEFSVLRKKLDDLWSDTLMLSLFPDDQCKSDDGNTQHSQR